MVAIGYILYYFYNSIRNTAYTYNFFTYKYIYNKKTKLYRMRRDSYYMVLHIYII